MIIGEEIYRFIEELYPISRSLTGNGVRETLTRIAKHIPLAVHEVPTGTQVLDWVVPKEWNIVDAYVKNERGERVIDFKKSNLHVMGYSVPIKKTMTLAELRPHLFSLPEHPGSIPYRTSYYEESWGFCISHNDLMGLSEGVYEVCIDSTLSDGNLTYGEYVVPGETKEEILISSHVCHPSLANDNLSGVALATYLAKAIQDTTPRYTYRFLFIPGTIGSITWLATHKDTVSNIKHGLVLTGIGDAGKMHYKKSRMGDTEIDRVVSHALRHSGLGYTVLDFSPFGYDERQYCSPGFNLSVGSLMRTPHGEYPEYHSSADNLEFVRPAPLAEAYVLCQSVFSILEGNALYTNQIPFGEPQLGRRGLYETMGAASDVVKARQLAMLWVLNFSDGNNSLLDIAERSGIEFSLIRQAADLLVKNSILI